MRVEFAKAIIENHLKYNNQVFLTGDLGYRALEEVKKVFKDKFINAGVAEQNMITVAASLANEGFIPWVYSIAPFITLRPYEQIRNNIGLHNLPVKIVGNGGGFGYGIMGATHHCIEDIGAMRMIQNMEVFVPFIATDVYEAVEEMLLNLNPNYLRLNKAVNLKFSIEPFKIWRKLKSGNKAIIIGIGPVLGNLFNYPELIENCEIWLVSKFPLKFFPKELLESIKTIKKILTIEEHISVGGLGQTIAQQCLEYGLKIDKFKSLAIQGYISGKYGNQEWHLEENGLAGESLKKQLLEFI